jgi:hypothetical protein
MRVELVVATLVEFYQWVHQVLRDEIVGLTPEQLSHVPREGTSSLAVLVTHALGSEAEVWSIVAGRVSQRDRSSEFLDPGTTAPTLLDRLDAADRLLDELAPAVDAAALAKVWERPKRSPHTGAHWLIHNYGHAREHLAHLQLTKQLFPDVYPPVARPM